MPWKKLLILFGILCFWMVFVLFKGSQSGKSVIGVECGTWPFWLLLSSSVPILVGLSFVLRKNLLEKQRKKEELGYHFLVTKQNKNNFSLQKKSNKKKTKKNRKKIFDSLQRTLSFFRLQVLSQDLPQDFLE